MDLVEKTDSERIDEIFQKYVTLENKVNETITMVNQLIVNVNSSNQFVCNIHNALAQAGLCKSPEEIVKEIEAQKVAAEPEPEPEPEMDTAD